MVYLPPELNRRRSVNAANLSQNQQALGVVPESRQHITGGVPTPHSMSAGGIPTGEGGFTPSMGQPQQPSRLTEYLQTQQQQRQMLVDRGEDLRLAQLMSRTLDPSMPKGFRQLGLRQISQMLGIDPRGDRAKEIINTISGLDPQSLEGLRRGIIGATSETQPGELTQMTRGVLTGQVPPDQLLSLASSAMQPPAGGEEQRPMMLGGPRPDLQAQAREESPVIQAQAPGQQYVPGARLPPRDIGPADLPSTAAPTTDVPRTDEARTPYRMREVEPEITNVLGLGLDNRYRLIDVMRAGWNRIPSDPEQRRKMFTEITQAQSGVVDTLAMASHLASLIGQGGPEALDASIYVPYIGTIGVNPSSLGSKVYEFATGLINIGGGQRGPVEPGQLSQWLQDTAANPKNQRFGAALASKIVKWAEESGQRVQDTAELNSRINSVMVPLAFAMAAAKGQTGRFLSDRDVEFQLREIGQSNNPQQFMAALTDMAARLSQQYDTRMRTATGASIPITPAMSPEARQMILAGGIAPNSLLQALGGVPPARAAAVGQPTPTPPRFPGIEVDQPGVHYGMDPQGRPIPMPAPAAPAPRTEVEPAAPARGAAVQRVAPTIEAEEQAALSRIQEDRAAALEQRAQNRRRLEITESQEARAQRSELEQRRQRIQQAFAQIGAALRGAISTGGGGVISPPGGEQDAGAFRISPAPQRRPPAPVPAGQFQPQLPQRRR